jgi:hypothetical protein
LLPSLNFAIRRQVFEKVGGFDERYPKPSGEDADLSIRLRKSGFYLEFDPTAVVVHNPPRHRLVDLLRHGYYQGKYSTKVDPRYAQEDGLPRLVRTRVGLILFSPLLAVGSLYRMIKTSQEVQKHWYTLPALFLAKIAWCIGAASHPTW